MVEGIQAKTVAVETEGLKNTQPKKEEVAKEEAKEVEAQEKEATPVSKEVLAEITGKGGEIDTTA